MPIIIIIIAFKFSPSLVSSLLSALNFLLVQSRALKIRQFSKTLTRKLLIRVKIYIVFALLIIIRSER